MIEEMDSTPLLFHLSLILVIMCANNIDAARRDPGDYWKVVMKDQPMPEAIQGLISKGAGMSNDCQTSSATVNTNPVVGDYSKHRKRSRQSLFAEDIQPRPNLSAYHDDQKSVTINGETSFKKDFDPTPNASLYHHHDNNNNKDNDNSPKEDNHDLKNKDGKRPGFATMGFKARPNFSDGFGSGDGATLLYSK